MSIKLYVEKSVEDLILKDMFKHIGLKMYKINFKLYSPNSAPKVDRPILKLSHKEYELLHKEYEY